MTYPRTEWLVFSSTPTHVWAAICPHCNHIVGTVVDTPAVTDAHRDIQRWKREGLLIERMDRPTAVAKLYQCTCADSRKAARNAR